MDSGNLHTLIARTTPTTKVAIFFSYIFCNIEYECVQTSLFLYTFVYMQTVLKLPQKNAKYRAHKFFPGIQNQHFLYSICVYL